jgi:cation:H+ antiporter
MVTIIPLVSHEASGMSLLLLLAGLAVLTLGAEWLVRGASSLALAMRVSPLVVGLTIVAFGTSTPELVVSVRSSLAGQADIALGNVVGSNIFNVLFILGISAAITPLVVAQQLVRFDVPLMIGLSVLTAFLGWDGALGRGDGLLFVGGLIAYTVWVVRVGGREPPPVAAEYAEALGPVPPAPTVGRILWRVVLVLVGLGLLVWGSRLFIEAAIEMARALGVSELVIGLTLVAAGTSLPEVATSVLAAVKGERDIAVGNVVGSNLFNILGVLGVSAAVAPQGVAVSPAALAFDIPVMMATAVACLPVFFTGHCIARWEGLMFLGYYAAYVVSLILLATHPQAGNLFAWVMGLFVIPLTVLTLLIGVARQMRQDRPRP